MSNTQTGGSGASHRGTCAAVGTHAVVDAFADFKENLDFLVWGVGLMHSHPPLLDPLHNDRIRNPNSGRSPQALNALLLQHSQVALETVQSVVVGPEAEDAAVEVCRDGLESHFVKRQFNEGV